MGKKLLRMASIFLCLSMLCGVTAYAAEARISSQINRYSTKLTTKSDGNLNLLFTITSNGTMTYLGASSVVIQRYNGSCWAPEYTYTIQNTPSLQTSNTNYHSKTLTYTPKYAGNDYRAVVNFYAQDSSMTSTNQATTSTVTT